MKCIKCGGMEFGICEVCSRFRPLQRTYWRYNIKCTCHSPHHFTMVRHCSECTPTEPTITVIRVRTDTLERLKGDEITKDDTKKSLTEKRLSDLHGLAEKYCYTHQDGTPTISIKGVELLLVEYDKNK